MLRTYVKKIAVFSVLPLYLAFRIFNPFIYFKKLKNTGYGGLFYNFVPKEFTKKLLSLSAALLILLPVWIAGYYIFISAGYVTVTYYLGYREEPILLAGTGSMYPTFPKGTSKDPRELAKETVGKTGMLPYPNGLVFRGKRYLNYDIGRGDIVAVENDKTDQLTKDLYGAPAGWVKRVIAIQGDTLELRGGLVYLNSEPLKEPYTARAHSTFGEGFLKDCTKITVPEGSIFIMGDNRKESGDSREVGFFALDAVDHVIPLKNQIGRLDRNWRNTDNDLSDATKVRLNNSLYLELLNKKRAENGILPLKYQPKLEKSSSARGKVMLKFNDFTFESENGGYSMKDALKDANYSNIVYAEAPTIGYYEAEELINYQFEFPESKKFLLNTDFQDIGISEVEGDLNGCPAQVIVQHFAGYVPPDYTQEEIDNWRHAVATLDTTIKSWEVAVGWENVNQENLKKLLEILKKQKSIAGTVLSRMEANEWLTDAEQNSISEFENLTKESIELANKLNNGN